MTKNKPVVLITGAARRIGAAIATHLHATGFQIVIHAHQSLAEAHALCDTLNQQRAHSAQVVTADLNDPAQYQSLIAQSLAAFGQLNLLIHNASLFLPDDTLQANYTDWQTLMTVNVYAPACLSEYAFPALSAQHGQIIYLSDTHAQRPLKGYALYCQSKAALSQQMQALALKFAPTVRVNAIAPGAILWPEGVNTLTASQQAKIIAQTPLQQAGNPQYIAQMIQALIDNPFITGQTIAVDGGRGIKS